jgi:hypothetical protein
VTHFSSSAKDGWVDSFQFKEKKNIFNDDAIKFLLLLFGIERKWKKEMMSACNKTSE